MSFSLGITNPNMWFDCSRPESVERAAAVGMDAVEFLGFDDDEAATLAATEEHDLEFAGTSAPGAGSNLDDVDAPALGRPEDHETAVADLEAGIEQVADLGGSTLIALTGPDLPIEDATQHTAIVRALREVAPAAEAAGVTVVLEPLNVRVDHPGYFLTTTGRGVEIVEAVDSPNVRLLYDVYHQQITEGDVVRRFRENQEYIGHVHVADNPGRHEPGTGELAYGRIFEAIADASYEGCVSCEFGPEADPETAFRHVVELADAAR